MYENVIFAESQEDNDLPGLPDGDESHGNEEVQPEGQTTMITWPLTTQATEEHSRTRGDISFLRPSASISRIRSQLGTQESQETDSYNYSDASSIGQFPAFHFSLHTLTPLSTLIDQANAARAAGRMPLQKVSHKVSILAAVLEVDGPDSIRIKKGPDAGKEVALLKIILGDESGGICKLAAWREIAEDWGGLNPAVPTPATKKGDIVLLESVLASWEPDPGGTSTTSIPISLSASPQLKSRLEICYRTLPSAPQDARLRPDLRLGLSDAAVRKVAGVVRWFEGVAGLAP
ncbi:uncharacterized protein TRAVEDRAFT_62705 [Trametes versicolor FP-101664 SS1]|uniref:uncharacterized protein n=1 Tax=Trametes versicolor (strain FP-101664) TaxID=717944 RepID=UPI0004623A4F|nr:uncharacterized protein TRAVEDRAFT_62705 [Trametes versicolor FP-101664 SS1]EIW62945.1 hypothetical protein TRAVEDRAFT_62705 [Trametes versicolor FP-101664 SS1]